MVPILFMIQSVTFIYMNHHYSSLSKILNGAGSYRCERRPLGSDLVRCSLYWLSFLTRLGYCEIHPGMAFQIFQYVKSEHQNGKKWRCSPSGEEYQAVSHLNPAETYEYIRIKWYQMTTEFFGTFLLLPSSGAGGWRQRNCHCTSWPRGVYELCWDEVGGFCAWIESQTTKGTALEDALKEMSQTLLGSAHVDFNILPNQHTSSARHLPSSPNLLVQGGILEYVD